MVVGEFTVSNIHMDEDKRDEDKQKGVVDMVKLGVDIAAATALAKASKLHEALEALLNLEKSSRLAEDVTATKACCSAILSTCFEAGDWKMLEEHIMLLSKRRSQLKQAIQAFVRQAMTYIDKAPNQEAKVALIKTLQAVTEGKIFVEIERARLTRRLAAINEAEGKIDEAADTLQEVPVETFGAMAKTEKIAFILEQVRLCLAKKDYIRAQILSRKISPRAFVERKGESKGEIGIEGTAIEAPEEGVPGLAELKLSFYELMVQYHSHYNNYLEMTRCYRAMYETEEVSGDEARWGPMLKKICWLLVLSPSYSTDAGSTSDRATLLSTTVADKKLGELPVYKALLATFSASEIIPWKAFSAAHASEIDSQADIFGTNEQRAKDLRLRVTEHNVMVVAKYYTRVTVPRLSELLDLPAAEAEKQLSDLVVSKAICARVDRPAGIITFGKRQAPEEALNAWSSNIGRLLDLVDKSTQQIQKEAMIHKVDILAGSS
uniref:PCI domain-containing protein n=1 Tax=Chlamydomonas euryale TaxID=1486919 RepID=A0A7R9YZL2_9CHLO|mmetsp:Transcript_36412/g.107479  ORF Transcript_36412/g.107479 Transcript_36412/m.107479 type:complete len:492 (+) Transcript_36412:134-1609(+)